GSDEVGGHRRAEVFPLREVAAELRQDLGLRWALDSLGDRDEAESSRDRDRGLGDGSGRRIPTEAGDESAVHLDRRKRESLQLAERRLTGAEVVERQANAELVQLAENLLGAVTQERDGGLRQLELQQLRRKPAAL